MSLLRTFIATLLLVASAQAFVASHKRSAFAPSTSLSFGFLKELGLEKPSWLPDFGAKKEDATPAPAEASSDEEESEDDTTPVDE
jgi:hypothetical protein